MAPVPALATDAALFVEDAQTGEAAVIAAEGAVLIVTVLLPVALHPLLLVTVTESVTVPDPPAVYLMLLVPLPAVIVPLLIVQV